MKTLFFNPFQKYSERHLLLVGIAATLVGGILAFLFHTRFDGVIDLHFVNSVTTIEVLSDLAIDIILMAIALFIAGKISNSKTRFIDVFNTVLIARIPLYFLTFFNIGNLMFDISERMLASVNDGKITALDPADLGLTVAFGFLTLAFLVWFFVLLWNGFRIATNAKGVKTVLLFIGAIIIGEIVSKIIISSLASW